jgi:hypothetical protein
METLEQKFLELTQEWYTVIGGEPHKDRDCHFWLGPVNHYAYGQPPQTVWKFIHDGYLAEDVHTTFDSPEECYNWAINWLSQEIETQRNLECTNDEIW